MRVALAIALFSLVAACAGLPPEQTFVSDHSGDGSPWKHENFDAGDDKFTFAVFADLTGRERPRVFDVAVAQLNLLRPELILNVGDLIEGGTSDAGELHRQWDSFDERAARARAPVFYVGGNHDLTGEALRSIWSERNGPRYYHFVYKNTLFLVLDTEDSTLERVAEVHAARNAAIEVLQAGGMGAFQQTEYWNMPERTSGAIGSEQSDYFLRVIEENPAVRWTFLFLHKPAWTNAEDENFSAIEDALANRPYTVFNGHVQAYNYEERLGRDYIQVATSGGEQFPDLGRSMDHIAMVTVDQDSVDIANLVLSGILDKTGKIPLGGGDLCFETAVCGE